MDTLKQAGEKVAQALGRGQGGEGQEGAARQGAEWSTGAQYPGSAVEGMKTTAAAGETAGSGRGGGAAATQVGAFFGGAVGWEHLGCPRIGYCYAYLGLPWIVFVRWEGAVHLSVGGC